MIIEINKTTDDYDFEYSDILIVERDGEHDAYMFMHGLSEFIKNTRVVKLFKISGGNEIIETNCQYLSDITTSDVCNTLDEPDLVTIWKGDNVVMKLED